MKTEKQRINDAWLTEGELKLAGQLPQPDPAILRVLVPPGGEWDCKAKEGAVTRSIFWGRMEFAVVNPHGALDDATEGEVAMGLRATPVMDTALRVIYVLSRPADIGVDNMELINRVARAAIAYAEQPAPEILVQHEDTEAGED